MKVINRYTVLALGLVLAALGAAALNVPYDPGFTYAIPFLFGTALATDRDTAAKDAGLLGYLVQTNVVIWKGSMVGVADDGYLVPASDTAAQRIVGVADETVNNNPGAAGAKKCRVRSGKAFLFAATSITQAMVGDRMHVVDDQTFDEAVGTNTIPCGRLVQFISTTSGYIFIPDGGLIKGGTAVVDAVS